MNRNIFITLLSSAFLLVQSFYFSASAQNPSSKDEHSITDVKSNFTQCADVMLDETSRDFQEQIGIADVVIRSMDHVCINQSFRLDAAESRYPSSHDVKFYWDLGDGTTQTGVKVQKKYSFPGDYSVTLTLQDFSEGRCSIKKETKVIHVDQPPFALAGEDVEGCVGESLQFDGRGSESKIPEALFAEWDFGDATQEKGISVNHFYKAQGTYSAVLTVRDSLSINCAASRDQKTVRIYSSPKVSLSVSQTQLCSDQEFELKATAYAEGNRRLNYFWSFDNGTILKAGPVVRHRFVNSGSYKVSVAVDDGRGTLCSSDSAFVQISVFPLEQCANGKIKF